jgi:hypothetical protein
METVAMSYTENDPRLSDVDRAQGPCEVIRNAYWAVHPERGLVFYTQTPRRGLRGASPQCNQDRNVADRIVPHVMPWAEIRQIPLVMWRSD